MFKYSYVFVGHEVSNATQLFELSFLKLCCMDKNKPYTFQFTQLYQMAGLLFYYCKGPIDLGISSWCWMGLNLNNTERQTAQCYLIA